MGRSWRDRFHSGRRLRLFLVQQFDEGEERRRNEKVGPIELNWFGYFIMEVVHVLTLHVKKWSSFRSRLDLVDLSLSLHHTTKLKICAFYWPRTSSHYTSLVVIFSWIWCSSTNPKTGVGSNNTKHFVHSQSLRKKLIVNWHWCL